MQERKSQKVEVTQLSGWLKKQGDKGMLKVWAKRYFHQYESRLYYYKSENDVPKVSNLIKRSFLLGSNHKGYIDLSLCIDVKQTGRLTFDITTQLGRTYHLEIIPTIGRDEKSLMDFWCGNLTKWISYYNASVLVSLPHALMNNILGYLEINDVISVSKVCKKLNFAVLNESSFWEKYCAKYEFDEGRLASVCSDISKETTRYWYEAFRMVMKKPETYVWVVHGDYFVDTPDIQWVKKSTTEFSVQNATLNGLWKYLLYAKNKDSSFFTTFFLSHHYFIEGKKLLDKLIQEYVQADESTDSGKQMRNKILRLFEYWIPLGMPNDSVLLESFLSFAREKLKPEDLQNYEKSISLTLDVFTLSIHQELEKPTSILPRAFELGQAVEWYDFDCKEIARQVSLISSDLFRKIKASEFVNWARESTELSPNIFPLMQRFQKNVLWSCYQVVGETDMNKRVSNICRVIQIAKELQQLYNFQDMCALIQGLTMPSSQRLKLTWEKVPKKTKLIFDELAEYQQNNYKKLGDEMGYARRTAKAVIPYVGYFLGAIKSLNIKYFSSDQVIAFSQLRTLVEYVEKLMKYQAKPFIFHAVPLLINYFQSTNPPAHEEMFKQSDKLEPVVK